MFVFVLCKYIFLLKSIVTYKSCIIYAADLRGYCHKKQILFFDIILGRVLLCYDVVFIQSVQTVFRKANQTSIWTRNAALTFRENIIHFLLCGQRCNRLSPDTCSTNIVPWRPGQNGLRFERRQFQDDIFLRKLFNFVSNVAVVCSQWPNKQ